MPVLITGADSQGTGTAQIDSIVGGPDIVAAAVNLVAGTHRHINVDPTAASVVLTLPPVVDGVKFFIKRVSNGNNSVTITGQTIDGIAGDLVLGIQNTFVELMGNAARGTYDVIGSTNPAAGQLDRSTPDATFPITTSFVKYNLWETAQFSTPDRIVANQPSSQIDLSNLRVGASGQRGLRAAVDFTLEYTNNTTIEMQVVHSIDGPVSGPIAVNCFGAGKPVSISFSRPFQVSAAGALWVEFKGENAGGTFTVINANMVVETF